MIIKAIITYFFGKVNKKAPYFSFSPLLDFQGNICYIIIEIIHKDEAMKKTVLVINGAGGVGKDTLCAIAAKHFKVENISSITPIKEVAGLFGWNGTKDDKSRKFLADLKQLTVEYNDYPTVWATEQYNQFLKSDKEVLFVHIREPEEIKKFVRATGGEAKTLLIRGGERMAKREYGNSADDCVENYEYDYYFINDKTLDIAESEFCSFISEILK